VCSCWSGTVRRRSGRRIMTSSRTSAGRQAQVTGAPAGRTTWRVDRAGVRGPDPAARHRRGVLAAFGWPASRLRIDERLDEYDHVGSHGPVHQRGDVRDGHGGRRAGAGAAVHAGGGDRPLDRRGIAGTGETHDAFIRRVMDAITETGRRAGRTIAVTSGGVIAAYCAVALGLARSSGARAGPADHQRQHHQRSSTGTYGHVTW